MLSTSNSSSSGLVTAVFYLWALFTAPPEAGLPDLPLELVALTSGTALVYVTNKAIRSNEARVTSVGALAHEGTALPNSLFAA